MDAMPQRKYSYLCEIVSQLHDQLEIEFIKEIGKLETDLESLRMDIHRSNHENPALSKALTSIISEVRILLNKIYEIEKMKDIGELMGEMVFTK